MANSKEVCWKRSLSVKKPKATIWSQSRALRGEAELCYEQASLAAVASQTSLNVPEMKNVSFDIKFSLWH